VLHAGLEAFELGGERLGARQTEPEGDRIAEVEDAPGRAGTRRKRPRGHDVGLRVAEVVDPSVLIPIRDRADDVLAQRIPRVGRGVDAQRVREQQVDARPGGERWRGRQEQPSEQLEGEEAHREGAREHEDADSIRQRPVAAPCYADSEQGGFDGGVPRADDGIPDPGGEYGGRGQGDARDRGQRAFEAPPAQPAHADAEQRAEAERHDDQRDAGQQRPGSCRCAQHATVLRRRSLSCQH